MPVAWESIIPRIVEEAGLLPPDLQTGAGGNSPGKLRLPMEV